MSSPGRCGSVGWSIVHSRRVVGSVPRPGTCLHCQFDPLWARGSPVQVLRGSSQSMLRSVSSMSLSLPPSLSKKQWNIVLRWGLRKIVQKFVLVFIVVKTNCHVWCWTFLSKIICVFLCSSLCLCPEVFLTFSLWPLHKSHYVYSIFMSAWERCPFGIDLVLTRMSSLHTGVGKRRFTVVSKQYRPNTAILIVIICMSVSIQTTTNPLSPACILGISPLSELMFAEAS